MIVGTSSTSNTEFFVVIGMFIEAFEAVLKDKRFQLSSRQATRARNLTSSIVKWSKDPANHESLALMSGYMATLLTSCMVTTTKTKKLKTVKMWGLYHLLRTSSDFKQQWITFIKMASDLESSTASHPALCQFVTHELMKNFIRKYHSVTSAAGSSNTRVASSTLSFEEQNALRFIAGYVSRKIYKNVQESSHPEKEGMVTCIKEMIGGCSNESDDTDSWLKIIDRGGLWHVNQEVYALFELIEEHIRHHILSPLDYSEGSKDIIIEELVNDEDVLFQWCFCFAASKINNEAGLMILRQMVSLYVTIRGFGFAETCLEMYKQAKETTISKKKALRKEITSNFGE